MAKFVELGVKKQDSVGKNTTYLVVDEAPRASKLTKAQKHDTKLVDEGELVRVIVEQ